MAVTPKSSAKTLAGAMETKSRLEMCWRVDIKWELYPKAISEVTISLALSTYCVYMYKAKKKWKHFHAH